MKKLFAIIVVAAMWPSIALAEENGAEYNCGIYKVDTFPAKVIEEIRIKGDSFGESVMVKVTNRNTPQEIRWRVFKADGWVKVEAANANSQIYTRSSALDGQAILVELPFAKNAMKCDPKI